MRRHSRRAEPGWRGALEQLPGTCELGQVRRLRSGWVLCEPRSFAGAAQTRSPGWPGRGGPLGALAGAGRGSVNPERAQELRRSGALSQFCVTAARTLSGGPRGGSSLCRGLRGLRPRQLASLQWARGEAGHRDGRKGGGSCSAPRGQETARGPGQSTSPEGRPRWATLQPQPPAGGRHPRAAVL